MHVSKKEVDQFRRERTGKRRCPSDGPAGTSDSTGNCPLCGRASTGWLVPPKAVGGKDLPRRPLE